MLRLLGDNRLAKSAAVRRENASRRVITLMATPPTVTLSAANAATSIASSTLRAPKGVGVSGGAIDMAGDPYFSYSGTPSMAALTSTNSAYASAPTLTGTTSSQRYAPTLGFNFYGDAFEIVFKVFTTHWEYRLKVDGQWVSLEAQYLSGLTSGAVYRILVTFPSVGERKIELDFNGNAIGGIQAAPAHTVSRALDPADIPTIVLGDSITAGANPGSAAGTVRNDTWINYTAHILGWRNLYNVAIAGTGYSVTGTEAAFTTRTADYAVTGARVVVYAGLNDGANYATTLPAAIDTVLGAIKAAGPAELIVMGWHPKNANDYANGTANNVNTLLASKAATYGATFVDPINVVKWVTGTGNSSTPNGSGNADLFVNADNVHPTREGHIHLGRVNADAIAATMPRLTN